jgi:hypothetical protein
MRKQNGLFFLMVFFGTILTFAQDLPTEPNPDINLELKLDIPLVVTLRAETATDLLFMGKTNQVVQISTQTSGENAPDTVLTLLDPQGHVLAHQDDQWLEGVFIKDAHLLRVVLLQDGAYIVRVDSFNGVSAGEVQVTIREVSDSTLVSQEDGVIVMQVNLAKGAIFRHVIQATTDQPVRIHVRDLSTTLDTLVRVLDANGVMIASADDAYGQDNLDMLDTALTLVIPQDGAYTLEIRDFLGREGVFELTIRQN